MVILEIVVGEGGGRGDIGKSGLSKGRVGERHTAHTHKKNDKPRTNKFFSSSLKIAQPPLLSTFIKLIAMHHMANQESENLLVLGTY